jgi:hypothetical protein
MHTLNLGQPWPGLGSRDPFDAHIDRRAVTGRERDVNVEEIASRAEVLGDNLLRDEQRKGRHWRRAAVATAPEAGDRLRGPTSAVESEAIHALRGELDGNRQLPFHDSEVPQRAP